MLARDVLQAKAIEARPKHFAPVAKLSQADQKFIDRLFRIRTSKQLLGNKWKYHVRPNVVTRDSL